MNANQIKETIAKLQKGVDNPHVSAEHKAVMRKKIKELESMLTETTERTPAKKPAPKPAARKPAAKPAATKKMMTMQECEELIKKYKIEAQKNKEWKKKREQAGKPPAKTEAEVMGTAAKTVQKKIENKTKATTKVQATAIGNDILTIVETVKSNMTTQADAKAWLNSLIAELKKLL